MPSPPRIGHRIGHGIGGPSVCVFCGSRPGRDPAFAVAATDLGTALAREGWRLVFGAGETGLMGAVAAAVREAGGASLGVIPEHLLGHETIGPPAGPVVVTETMHARKKLMFTNSDAVVVLPGGAGTMDEFFEVLTWAQLGLHARPVYLLDTAGYFAPVLALLDHLVEAGFAEPSLLGLATPVPDVPALVAHLRRAFADPEASPPGRAAPIG